MLWYFLPGVNRRGDKHFITSPTHLDPPPPASISWTRKIKKAPYSSTVNLPLLTFPSSRIKNAPSYPFLSPSIIFSEKGWIRSASLYFTWKKYFKGLYEKWILCNCLSHIRIPGQTADIASYSWNSAYPHKPTPCNSPNQPFARYYAIVCVSITPLSSHSGRGGFCLHKTMG